MFENMSREQIASDALVAAPIFGDDVTAEVEDEIYAYNSER